MFYASFPWERLEGIARNFCPIVRPQAFYLPYREQSAMNVSVACTVSLLLLRKLTNTVPEKSSVKAMLYLKPSLDTGSIGPAKSVCTISKGFVALASGLLFLLLTNFPCMHVSQLNLDLSELPDIFIPSTTACDFMTSSKLQWPNISCHVWMSCETLTLSLVLSYGSTVFK